MQNLPEDQQERLRFLQEKFYKTLGGFFSGGTYDNVLLGLLDRLNKNVTKSNESLALLNEMIQKADASSTKLSSALNRITFWGALIAGIGVLVAGAGVLLQYIQFFSRK